jgi:hypothetical protein
MTIQGICIGWFHENEIVTYDFQDVIRIPDAYRLFLSKTNLERRFNSSTDSRTWQQLEFHDHIACEK